MISRLSEWDKIFNFNFVNLIVTSRLYPFLLILQIIWLIFIAIKIFKHQRSFTIALNLFIYQFTSTILLYIHYLNKLETTLFEYTDSIRFSYKEILITENRWLTFFSYEIILSILSFILIIFYLYYIRDRG